MSSAINFLRHDYEDYLDPEIDTFRFSREILEISPKICYRQTANRIIASIDYEKQLCDKTVHVIVNKKGFKYDLRIVTALLNSELFLFFYKQISQETDGRTFSQVKTTYIKKLPFKYVENNSFKTIVEYLESCNDSLPMQFFLKLNDSIVYELYFPDKLKSANKEILKHLDDLKPITDDMSEEEKLAIIQAEFERLYDPSHAVRNDLETLDSIEEVRIIKEALK